MTGSSAGVRPVTLHVWRVPRSAVPRALWRMAVDRRRLRRTPGVSFAKLLGTGRDLRFGLGDADPTRWAAIVVWHDAAAAEEFAGSPVGRSWAAIATAGCRLTLRPVSSRGRWAGRAPFDAAAPGGPIANGPGPAGNGAGPMLVLTRARLRPARAPRFWRTIPRVARALPTTPGLLAAFGVGEAPLGWQGTISVWRNATDLVGFAYRRPGHRAVVAATPARRWYVEELFARFAVLDISGDRDVLGWTERDDPG
ncbi:MAG: hypothetical protein QOI74_20 [Micromonosporaceae bacterium]|nr:hypothetical protein [Micromonosporaceae bacterium]